LFGALVGEFYELLLAFIGVDARALLEFTPGENCWFPTLLR